MEQSPRLSLSYVMPAQAQKHVTVNETFRRLDALTQMSALSRSETAEPSSPAEGEAYILPSGASGDAWDSYDEHDIAIYQDGAWARIAPIEGFRCWVSDDDEYVVFDGAAWAEISGGGGSSETAEKFGVYTTADTTNRLAVKSDAVLFNYDDITPGSGDCQVKINKDAEGDTGTLLFQTGAFGRAELGLAGDDDFHIKVSPDNFSTTYDAVLIDKDNGNVGIGGGADARLTVTGLSGFAGPSMILKNDGYAAFQDFIAAGSGATFHAPFFQMKRARGTLSSPSTVADGDVVAGIPMAPWNSVAGDYDARARIQSVVNGTVSGATVPTDLIFFAGSTNDDERMRIYSNGGVVIGSPTGGSKGAGTLNAVGVYDDNALLSCYVFDQALNGSIDPAKWDARVPDRRVVTRDGATNALISDETIARSHEPMRKFAARAGTDYDPLTLDGYARHWKEKRHLTAMPNEAAYDPVNGPLAAGEWIQRLVETVEIQAVLIETLNERVKAVEARA